MGRRAIFLSDEKPRDMEKLPPKYSDVLRDSPQDNIGGRKSLLRALSEWIFICFFMVIALTSLLELLNGKASTHTYILCTPNGLCSFLALDSTFTEENIEMNVFAQVAAIRQL